jgi:poly(A) polymerase
MIIIDKIFEIFEKSCKEIFLVGGAVRDIVLRCLPPEEISDFDFATEAGPEEVIDILIEAGLAYTELGKKFGTIELKDYPIQITTYRQEIYLNDTRFPQVSFVRNLREDLSRRDFRFNAMAMDKNFNLIDPYLGKIDWNAQIIDCPSDPDIIFQEDPLRILRGFRFMSRYGFDFSNNVEVSIKANLDKLENISHERWLMEMDKILVGEYLEKTLYKMKDTGVLYVLLPEVSRLAIVEQGFPHTKDAFKHSIDVCCQIRKEPDLKWAALIHDVGKYLTRMVVELPGEVKVHFYEHEEKSFEMWQFIADRFKLSNERREKIGKLIRLHMRPGLYNGKWGRSAVRRLRKDAGEDIWDLLELCKSDITSTNEWNRTMGLVRMTDLEKRLRETPDYLANPTVLPKGTGDMIMRVMKIPPGKEVGVISRKLSDRIIDGLLEPDLQKMEQFLSIDTNLV